MSCFDNRLLRLAALTTFLTVALPLGVAYGQATITLSTSAGDRVFADSQDALNPTAFTFPIAPPVAVTSMRVGVGVWELFSQSGFRGLRYVVHAAGGDGSGYYDAPGAWGAADAFIGSIRRVDRPLSTLLAEPAMDVYKDRDGEGTGATLLGSSANLSHAAAFTGTLNDTISSVRVRSGTFLLYSEKDFFGRAYVVHDKGGPAGDGVYDDAKAWEGSDNEISSVAASELTPEELRALPLLHVFKDRDGHGTAMSITESLPNLSDGLSHHTFNDTISSLRVISGTWLLYPEKNMGGEPYRVTADGGKRHDGVYDDAKDWGGKDNEISSIAQERSSFSGNRNVRFFATADPQFNGDEVDDPNVAPARVGAFLDTLNGVDGRGLVIAGDLTQNANRDEWLAYERHYLSSQSHRVYDGLGNHDVPEADRSWEWITDPWDQAYETLELRDYIPRRRLATAMSWPPHYSWDWDDVHLVQLNTYPGRNDQARLHAAPPGPNDSLAFMEFDLAHSVGSSGRPVVLVHHYGIDDFSLETCEVAVANNGGDPLGECTTVEVGMELFPWIRDQFAKEAGVTRWQDVQRWWSNPDARDYWNALAAYNVAAILVGHKHPIPGDNPHRTWTKPAGAAARPDGRTELPVFFAGAARNRVYLDISMTDTEMTLQQMEVDIANLTSQPTSQRHIVALAPPQVPSPAPNPLQGPPTEAIVSAFEAAQLARQGPPRLLRSRHSDLCLAPTKPTDGAPVALQPCDIDPPPRWEQTAERSLRHASSGLCLRRPSAPGPPRLAPCSAGPGVDWVSYRASEYHFQIRGDSLCLRPDNASRAPGLPVETSDCGEATLFHWYVDPLTEEAPWADLALGRVALATTVRSFGDDFGPVVVRRQGPVVTFCGVLESTDGTWGEVGRIPEGFRPPTRQTHLGRSYEGNVVVEVLPDGRLRIEPGATPRDSPWVSLASVSYSLEPGAPLTLPDYVGSAVAGRPGPTETRHGGVVYLSGFVPVPTDSNLAAFGLGEHSQPAGQLHVEVASSAGRARLSVASGGLVYVELDGEAEPGAWASLSGVRFPVAPTDAAARAAALTGPHLYQFGRRVTLIGAAPMPDDAPHAFVWTLPEGARPSHNVVFPGTSGDDDARIVVHADGRVCVIRGPAGGRAPFVHLGGVSFFTP